MTSIRISLILLLASVSASAVVIDLGTAVVSTSLSGSLNGQSADLLGTNGPVSNARGPTGTGNVSTTASLGAYASIDGLPSLFDFNLSSATTSVIRASSSGSPVQSTFATSVLTLTLTVLPSETATADFSFNYSILGTLASSLSYSLVGPGATNLYSGSFSTGSGAVSESAMLSSGTYTLTVTSRVNTTNGASAIASIPSSANGTVGITGPSFTVNAVPEPGGALLGGLGVLVLLRRCRTS